MCSWLLICLFEKGTPWSQNMSHNCFLDHLPLWVPIVTNINFLLPISIHCQEIRLWELIKWSPRRKCFDPLSNSLNLFFKEMYRDQFWEFVCGYWGLKGYWGCISLLLGNFIPVHRKSPSSLCKRQLGLVSFLFSKWPIGRRSHYVTLPW